MVVRKRKIMTMTMPTATDKKQTYKNAKVKMQRKEITLKLYDNRKSEKAGTRNLEPEN